MCGGGDEICSNKQKEIARNSVQYRDMRFERQATVKFVPIERGTERTMM